MAQHTVHVPGERGEGEGGREKSVEGGGGEGVRGVRGGREGEIIIICNNRKKTLCKKYHSQSQHNTIVQYNTIQYNT